MNSVPSLKSDVVGLESNIRNAAVDLKRENDSGMAIVLAEGDVKEFNRHGRSQ